MQLGRMDRAGGRLTEDAVNYARLGTICNAAVFLLSLAVALLIAFSRLL